MCSRKSWTKAYVPIPSKAPFCLRHYVQVKRRQAQRRKNDDWLRHRELGKNSYWNTVVRTHPNRGNHILRH